MVVKHSQLLDSRRRWSNLSLCIREVLKILSTTRIRAVSRRDKSKRVSYAIRCHFPERVRQQWMPVPIAPVDWQSRSIGLQLFFERRYQISILLIDRTHATEQFVVMRHLEHSLTRDVPTAQDVFEEGNHIVHSLRPTKRHHQQSIIIRLR